MTMDTWRDEFYPVAAVDCPREDAVAHSLKKWIGLRRENLERHGLETGWSDIHEVANSSARQEVSGVSCALCKFHAVFSTLDRRTYCDTCPLAQIRAVENIVDSTPVACDNVRPGESLPPWVEWTENKNPEPMIEWLMKIPEGAA